jgi:hypothetical protein
LSAVVLLTEVLFVAFWRPCQMLIWLMLLAIPAALIWYPEVASVLPTRRRAPRAWEVLVAGWVILLGQLPLAVVFDRALIDPLRPDWYAAECRRNPLRPRLRFPARGEWRLLTLPAAQPPR